MLYVYALLVFFMQLHNPLSVHFFPVISRHCTCVPSTCTSVPYTIIIPLYNPFLLNLPIYSYITYNYFIHNFLIHVFTFHRMKERLFCLADRFLIIV